MKSAHPTPEQLAAASVLVVGDAMLDRYWFGAVDRISPEAPVPVVRVSGEEERLGGAANVALNVNNLGARVSLITVVGDDEPGRKLKTMIEQAGIATLLRVDPQLYTIVKLRVIGRSQQLIRIDFENQPNHEVLQQALGEFERVIGDHQAVLFSDYGKGGLEHITIMIQRAQSVGIPVLIDPKGDDYKRYEGATVITPNRAELAQVVGVWSSDAQLCERAQRLREELKLDGVLLTRSEGGMSLFDVDGHMQVAAQAREVFDVTGAGDTVIATLAAMLACGLSLREAVPIANRAAGIVVGRFGTANVSYQELFA